MKLLYFVDLQSHDLADRTMTGLEWVWYSFGPFSRHVYEVIDDLEVHDEITVEVGTNYFGSPEYRISIGANAGYYQVLSGDEIRIVEQVAAELGHVAPRQLARRSYKTPPMIRAQLDGVRGQKLRFDS
jgi:hypothetical protein